MNQKVEDMANSVHYHLLRETPFQTLLTRTNISLLVHLHNSHHDSIDDVAESIIVKLAQLVHRTTFLRFPLAIPTPLPLKCKCSKKKDAIRSVVALMCQDQKRCLLQ